MIFYNIQHFGDWTWLPWLLRMLAHPENQALITYDGPDADVEQVARHVTQNAPELKQIDVERSVPVRWCGPSQVAMQIDALRRALRRDGWEFFINLSGTCAPLCSQVDIRARLSQALIERHTAHISAFPVRKPVMLPEERPDAPVEIRKMRRLLLRGNAGLLEHFTDPSFFPISKPANRVFTLCREPEEDDRLLEVARPGVEDIAFRRAYFAENEHYCGRAWYVLHRSACEAILRFVDSPAFADSARVFMTCFEPDESFLPTLLMNGMCLPREQISKGNFRTFGGEPRQLDDQSFPSILANAPGFFTRKLRHGNATELRAFIEARVMGTGG